LHRATQLSCRRTSAFIKPMLQRAYCSLQQSVAFLSLDLRVLAKEKEVRGGVERTNTIKINSTRESEALPFSNNKSRSILYARRSTRSCGFDKATKTPARHIPVGYPRCETRSFVRRSEVDRRFWVARRVAVYVQYARSC
jgi:hypothetical protein